MAGVGDELSARVWSNGTYTTTVYVLEHVQFHYSWVLSVIFLAAFVATSILSVEPAPESKEPVLLGPGGKPLPRSARKSREERERKKLKDFSPSRKLFFFYLSVALLGTFLADAVEVVVHALVESDKGWWCGEATAVSGSYPSCMLKCALTSLDPRYTFVLRASSTV